MIQFYSLAVSNFCAKVEIALRLKGAPFEIQSPPGGYGSPEYKAIVPAGTIPAILVDDLVLSESDAIVEYLDEAYPGHPLLPGTTAERAKTRQRSRLHDTRFEPTVRALFSQMDPAKRDASTLHAGVRLMRVRFQDIGLLLDETPYLLGDQPGIADCAYAPTLHLADRMLDAVGMAPLEASWLDAWRRRIAKIEAFTLTLDRHDQAISAWLKSKTANAT